ncbi:hypothetical protein [Actinomadura violacea]|uniref:Uncharacterized protein n=1 Tax=Actinomadura violacea TaxID=2819934 RepID=A0ABS3RTU9_9ACTN|nr:hypothetical protein [Actinomadura violacea]MBO2460192.1 hypothetical protein [Actinomadura violacea]
MRCPGCGSDTNPALPRCTRCNAPLHPSPPDGPGHTISAGDETSRDPSEFGAATERDASARDGSDRDDEATRDYGVPPAPPVPPASGNPFGKPGGGVPPNVPGPAPGGFGGGYGEPLPPPWTPVPDAPEHGQWQPGSDRTSPMPPSGELSTPLGPEPWAEQTTRLGPEPWAEPAIWQPPAPAKKNTALYFLVAAGVVLLVVVALGIVFWPSGSGKQAGSAAGPASSSSGQPVTTDDESPTGSPSPSGDMKAQAGVIDGLLDDMAQTRSELGTVVADGCTTDGLQRIHDERQAQLDKANGLDVGALDNGAAMKDALVRALRASVESNQRYLDVAPGCPSDDEVAGVNQQASDAKNEFIGLWTPIASQAGLPARDGDNI